MRKRLLLAICLLSLTLISFANHLKGGFYTYEYLGAGSTPGTLRYKVSLTVYMVCNANDQQLTQTIPMTIYDAATQNMVANPTVNLERSYLLNKTRDELCIPGAQDGCYYAVAIYTIPSIELPDNGAGYVVAYQRCCRIAGINNMPAGSNAVGNTYAINIPGRNAGQNAHTNNSAVFNVGDTAVVCGGNYFQFPFSATDPDGDVLTYSFCDAWAGGTSGNAAPNVANSPLPTTYNPVSFQTIPYAAAFGGTTPMGPDVTINPTTGVISGIAPNLPGEYVVTVCVNEVRNGVVIARSRKELHVTVGSCNPIRATLNPTYVTCDGFNLTFSNLSNSSAITSYFWDFGVAGQTNDTSRQANPTFVYSDTGTYVIKLVVNRESQCADSTTAVAKVYPGFFPGFNSAGICATKPTQFTDTSRTVYGFIDTWRWDFGDNAATNDTSRLRNPAYSYPANGTYNVRFIVTSNKGCIDTVFKDIQIIDKPPIQVLPRDTLICNGDSLVLQGIGNGSFTWTPGTAILNANTANPTVFPTTTTNYIAQLNDNGCINTDTVRVRVVDFVTLAAMPDTTICATDSVRLRVNSNGLRYTWTPSAGMNDPTLQNPTVLPTASTTYQVRANIGRCVANEDVRVTLVPYPLARAGADTVICFNSSAQLNASITGASFSWSPTTGLNNPSILNPVATPPQTTAYVLTVTDIAGCPKPNRDTVLVTVLPRVNAFAGRDTAVVVGQPLQLNASGGVTYLWVPGTSLNNPAIANPIGRYTGAFDSIRYKVLVADVAGCTDSAYVTVRVFRTNPQIFVPTAFTPNGDGLNDTVYPYAVGLERINYFRIFNRWGQLVFQTTINGRGWDGRISGKEQGRNVFVWMVEGVDFTGKKVFGKGTVTLIR